MLTLPRGAIITEPIKEVAAANAKSSQALASPHVASIRLLKQKQTKSTTGV